MNPSLSEKQINIVNYNKPLPPVRIKDLNERTFFNERDTENPEIRDMSLVSGDNTYSYTQASFSVLSDDEKVGEFGARAVFSFSAPSDIEAFDKAVVTDSTSGDSKELDLSGFALEE